MERLWRICIILWLTALIAVLSACSSDSSSSHSNDGDRHSYFSDGDLEGDASENESDNDSWDYEGDKESITGEDDLADGDGPDGDLDDDPELESEPIEDDIEPEPEPEAEEEETPEPPWCGPETDPLIMWEEAALPVFDETGWEYEGEIGDPCLADGFIIAGAGGMEVSVRLDFRSFTKPLVGRLLVTDAAGASRRRAPVVYYDESMEYPLGPLEFSFTLPYSGEYLLVVAGKGNKHTGLYTVSARCESKCERRFTRHPIVLMHGMAGWDTALGFYDYFYGVREDLSDLGYNINITEAAMFNDSDYRALELESQLLGILEETGARKINIVAHSQGGLDGRIFISGMGHGEDVAVLAMIATPNQGVILGDMVLGTVRGISREVIASIFDFFANLVDGSDSDIEAALSQISVQHMRDNFNPAHPDDPDVQYWSWAGVSCRLIDLGCRDAHGGEWVNPAMSLTYGLIRDLGPGGIGCGENDGMIPLNSARYGEFMRILDADHADEIGQIKTGGFDHLALYREIADLLFTRGY